MIVPTLRPYQNEGVEFLSNSKRAILADEPGLGKTLQTIMALESLPQGPTLILAPKMALGVWEEEIRKWTGKISMIYDGNPKERKALWKAFQEDDLQFLITNYAKLKELRTLKPTWTSIVCDEIHLAGLQNHRTQTYENLRQLSSAHLFLLTGTPVNHGPQDLFAPLSLVEPDKYKSYWQYVNKYCIVIQDRFGKSIEGRPKDVMKFKQMLKPYFIHRKKKDHLHELPDKIRQPLPLTMTKDQAKIYNDIAEHMMAEFGDDILVTPSRLTQDLRLRQCLVSPRLLGFDVDGAALESLPELVDAEFQSGNPVIIFTPFREAVTHIVDKLTAVHGKSKKPTTNYVGIIQGGMKATDLQQVVHQFQTCKDVRKVLICTIKTAAAFTATAAKVAFFMGYEWNPNDNIQAEDRIHRIGQKDAVRVQYLLHKNTIDEYVKEVLNDKQRWANMILS